MAGAVLGLGAVGYFIDKRLGIEPIGVTVGLLLGVVVGMWDLYKTMYLRKDD